MKLEDILPSIFQEIMQTDYEKPFEDIRCDENYYYLYKHLSFDPDLYVLNLFKKLELKFTHPDNFNDPYDCVALIEFDGVPELHESFLQNQFLNAIREKLSVTCFNNNPLNMLMWSHYAQSHRGFLVEFKIPHHTIEWVNDAFNVQAVRYQESFPSYPFSILSPNTSLEQKNGAEMINFVTNQYLIKSVDWAYEKEFRVLAFDYDPSNFSSLLKIIPPAYLSSVILGAKLANDDPNKKALESSIEFFNQKYNQDIKIYQAKLKPNSFKIEVSDHPILDKETKRMRYFFSNH